MNLESGGLRWLMSCDGLELCGVVDERGNGPSEKFSMRRIKRSDIISWRMLCGHMVEINALRIILTMARIVTCM